MASIFNISNSTFEQKNSPIPKFSWHTTQDLASLVNSKHLDFDIRSLDPDKYSYPYHFHRNAEEIFVVLQGEATLRTPNGFQTVKQGDTIFFEIGSTGAHQIYNHTNSPFIYLDIRTKTDIDICEYPDSGKINILPFREIFQSDDKVDYFKGEENIKEKWNALKKK